MTGQQLKNSILQEAIMGRLVPQDPNDEPASVLLDKIRREKARLVKEGKLKKKDLEETPIQEDEKPFEIPESWEWVRLKDIVMFIGGYAYDSTSFIPSSDNQVLRLGNVKNDKILLNVNPVFIDDKLALDTEKFRCKQNDILITMTGTRKKRDYFFSVLVNSSHQNLYINQRVGCLRSIEENIAKWLVIAIKTEVILTDVFQYETGTANQGNLGAENILKTKIPLPPLSEQHRIVAKIEELLPKVEEYGKAQDALNKLNAELPERLKKSILQEAIEGRLVPQDPNDEPASVLLAKIRKEKEQLVKEGKLKKKDLIETPITEDEIPFEIPESWEWVRMSSLSYMISGTSYKKDDVRTDGIRILRGGNIQDNSLILCNDDVFVPLLYADEQKNVRKGDVLIVGSTGSQKVIGKPAIVMENLEKCQIGAFLRIIRPISSEVEKYIHLIFKSEYYRDNIRSLVQGTNIFNIRSEYIDDMIIPLPPLAEQHRIVEKLEQLLGEIDKLKK